jgi:hypothetical protein
MKWILLIIWDLESRAVKSKRTDAYPKQDEFQTSVIKAEESKHEAWNQFTYLRCSHEHQNSNYTHSALTGAPST